MTSDQPVTVRPAVTDDDLPVLLTIDEAAVLAHVEPGTIRVWTHRHRLKPVGRDTARRYLYDAADIIRLDTARHARSRNA